MMLVPLLLLAAQKAVPAPVLMAPPPARPGVTRAVPPVSAPVPRQPLLSLFSPDDYPAALAGRKGPRGVVLLALIVEASGRINTCAFKPSNADQALKIATCQILERRARFDPAVDARGTPRTGIHEVQIDWDAIFRKFGQR
jgi:protein TonB